MIDIPLATILRPNINNLESLHIWGRIWRKILTLNSIFLLVMSGFRIATLWLYSGNDQVSPTYTRDLLKALTMGVRFDAVVLGYLAVIPLLISLVCLHIRNDRTHFLFLKFARVYYFLFFILICVLLGLDVGYYSYFQDHFNILVFGLVEDDTSALLRTFWQNYPIVWISIFTFVGLFILMKVHQRVLREFRWHQSFQRIPFLLLTLVSVVAMSLNVMVARGSFGLFPLGPADTVVSRDPFLNYLTSNGIHALFRAVKLRRQSNSDWDNNMKLFGYTDPRQAFADFYSLPIEQVPVEPLDLFKHQTKKNPWAEATKPHVVVLMMESFGSYWMDFQSPSFNLLGNLEKHLKEDIFLKNFLPSTGSTTGSLSSIMISSAHRPIGNFLTESEYLQVPFRSSPARVYSRAGYETHFIYGGNPGWRDMNKFARFQGFDHVAGDVDMEAKLGQFKEKHDWGVYDHDVFRYVKKILEDATKPQMLLVMTTTNHPPYQTPSDYAIPEQKLPASLVGRLTADADIVRGRFRTYFYSNDVLGKFLDEMKASPLGEKTILAVTGDHGFLLINFTDEELLQKWAVPFYLYTPKAARPIIDPNTFGNHMDIFPTLYNLSLSDASYDAMGSNLADPFIPHYAYHPSGLVVGPDGGVLSLGKNSGSYFDWQDNTYRKLVPGTETAEKLKMATHYRGMMSLMDYYLMTEKKSTKR